MTLKDIIWNEGNFLDDDNVVEVLIDGTAKATDIYESYNTEEELDRILEAYGEDEIDSYEIEEREEWIEYYSHNDYWRDHTQTVKEVTIVIKLMTA